MYSRTLLILAAACLSACADRPAPAPAASTDPVAPVLPATNPLPVAAPAADLSTVPAGFIVSTNEPFWQARVDGASLALAGADGERKLVVESNEVSATGRHVLARDAGGTLEVTVTDKACQDDMSGAAFPFTGSLSFDGAAGSHGCARRLTDPLPAVPNQ
ncbi:hypothetical protein DT603_01695 [Pseudoxanthomonas gei]|uniref:Lipoprotein n=1 Tax=Pseudoxanthomonas gei TaxID=1383030 RepID=A0ABX0A7P7_9GAMM|nr:hypothetical protein [Pseudoxanthomonas gei]NDK37558.1 hypothetical protein [Pseudoxanthomonas gei]